MENSNKIHREITSLSPHDSFKVFNRYRDSFDYPVHFHPEIELNFIENGKGMRRMVGDSIDEIQEYELVLVGSNLSHGWEMYHCPHRRVHEVTIQFHENLFDEVFLQRRIMKPLREMFERAAHGILFSKEETRKLAPRIMNVSNLSGSDYFLELLSILFCLANTRNQRLLSAAPGQYKKFENSKKIEVLYDYVQKNYNKKITLSDVSSLLNMSNVSFNRFIKKRTGKTFVDYLNDVRIGYASRWLVEKDFSVSEIAYMCGFNNIANFNRTFKKIKNCTPSKYRQDFSEITLVQ
ncbi:MAG: AraC family transcriptional regulator [Cellulophaga sp.]